jgi:UDP-glucose 4-epimerase
MTNVASEFGAGPVRVPRRAVSAGSEAIARLLSVPSVLEWLHVGRTSVVMDTAKAKTQLGRRPKHTAAETLSAFGQTVDALRRIAGVFFWRTDRLTCWVRGSSFASR